MTARQILACEDHETTNDVEEYCHPKEIDADWRDIKTRT
jgi:hypothetical protein